MSRLAFILRDLLHRARQQAGKATPPAKLQKGLQLSAKVEAGRQTLCLFRDAITRPSEEEALTCAHEIGWPGPLITQGQTTAGYPCLFVSPARAPAELPWTPGTPCAFLPQPQHMPPGKLLGLSTAHGWVTFKREVGKDSDMYAWRQFDGPKSGRGTWDDLRAWLEKLEGQGGVA